MQERFHCGSLKDQGPESLGWWGERGMGEWRTWWNLVTVLGASPRLFVELRSGNEPFQARTHEEREAPLTKKSAAVEVALRVRLFAYGLSVRN